MMQLDAVMASQLAIDKTINEGLRRVGFPKAKPCDHWESAGRRSLLGLGF